MSQSREAVARFRAALAFVASGCMASMSCGSAWKGVYEYGIIRKFRNRDVG